MASVHLTSATPLTLSLSHWERERCCERIALFRGPFSHGERDRVRGVAPDYNTLRRVIP